MVAPVFELPFDRRVFGEEERFHSELSVNVVQVASTYVRI